ncbi:MAG TPA: hypothetical protein VML95_04750 [Longimicrobiales bacterium]|nr:hypothetical protein [Longimicrobiales bacterium]
MSIACLWTPDWRTDEAPPAPAVPPDVVGAALAIVPRVALDTRGMIWADVRGLPVRETAERLRRTAGDVRVGVAGVPVAAEIAARWADGPSGAVARRRAVLSASGRFPGSEVGVAIVPPGADRAFVAEAPVALLEPPPSLLALLEGTGLLTCGALAVLSREAVEVRLGAQGARLWRLARADDPRRLFQRIPPLRPHASIDFVEYVITDPARLVFAANALITPICEELVQRGEHARSMTLSLPLANGRTWSRALRPGRPTASREIWLRLIRSRLERLSVPDAVNGVAVEVGATEPASVRQGDLFDRGFGSASAVEAALSRLIGELGEVVVRPENDAHPLAERRTSWRTRDPIEIADNRDRPTPPEAFAETPLTLQLLPEPREVRVDLDAGRPHRYHDRTGWRSLTVVAGPDRMSGGWWEDDAYAREYYRCVTGDGVLVWIYRDASRDRWLLQGWWD